MNARPMFLRWPARRPILDNQACSDLDEASILANHRPVYQRPAHKPMRLAGVIAITAVVSAIFVIAIAPIQTFTVVAMALGGSR